MKEFFAKLLKRAGDAAVKFGKNCKSFFLNLPQNLKKLGINMANGIKNWFLKYINYFKNGDTSVKLSYIFMGSGAFAHKQIVKGITYLGIELLFIFYMIFNGAGAIRGFFSLGTDFQFTIHDINNPNAVAISVPGDNSMMCLIYGVVAFIVIFAFIAVYFMNIRSAYQTFEDSVVGKKPQTFRQDLKQLFDNKFYIVLLSVALIGVIIFTILPLIFMILIAFTSWDREHSAVTGFNWVWFKNFGQLVGSTGLSSTFFPVLGWTLLWALCATFLNYFLGVALALLINKKDIKGQKVWRTFFVLTIAIPQFVSLLLMRNLLGEYGPIMNLIVQAGGERIKMFDNIHLARFLVIVINLWVGIPYSMLITSGILMNIPADLYESARIDGAGKLTMFRKITLPYILFVTGPYLITQFIGNINNFNVIYLLTGGGPFGIYSGKNAPGGTSLLITWLYSLTSAGVEDYKLASALGIVTFVICSVISLITYRYSSASKNEEDFQ